MSKSIEQEFAKTNPQEFQPTKEVTHYENQIQSIGSESILGRGRQRFLNYLGFALGVGVIAFSLISGLEAALETPHIIYPAAEIIFPQVLGRIALFGLGLIAAVYFYKNLES